MPCPHKFQEYLTLEGLDFEPTTLIVGTFNPAWPAGNAAEWFYGRTHDEHGNQNNNFWDVLPRIYGEDSLINATHIEWKSFCQRHKIAITDLISSIEDADSKNNNHKKNLSTYSDDDITKNFYDFELVNVVRLLRKHTTISNVYITRSFTESFWKHKIFPLKNYCGIKEIGLKPLLTPSNYASIQQKKYNKVNKTQVSLPKFILDKWKEQWHF